MISANKRGNGRTKWGVECRGGGRERERERVHIRGWRLSALHHQRMPARASYSKRQLARRFTEGLGREGSQRSAALSVRARQCAPTHPRMLAHSKRPTTTSIRMRPMTIHSRREVCALLLWSRSLQGRGGLQGGADQQRFGQLAPTAVLLPGRGRVWRHPQPAARQGQGQGRRLTCRASLAALGSGC